MKSEPERYEMLVVGSGEGGKFLAWHMAKAGHAPPLSSAS
jgi:choline dehydrogenase-like flavoprotein